MLPGAQVNQVKSFSLVDFLHLLIIVTVPYIFQSVFPHKKLTIHQGKLTVKALRVSQYYTTLQSGSYFKFAYFIDEEYIQYCGDVTWQLKERDS